MFNNIENFNIFAAKIRNMWILVNNIPINIFDEFFVSPVIEFNKDFLNNNVFYYNNNCSGRSHMRIILDVASSKKWFEVELMDSEIIEQADMSGHPYSTRKYIKKYEDSLDYDHREFFHIKPGFFFYVSDSHRVRVSELYDTKESAQEALEKLLSTVNKIVARLQRVTI